MPSGTKSPTIIDITPTWEGLLNVLLHVWRDAEAAEDRLYAHSELFRMAQAADKYNSLCKSKE